MQTAVHNHVSPVGLEGFVLLEGLGLDHLATDHQIPEQGEFHAGGGFEREGEHVGGLVLAAIGVVELAALRLVHQAHRHLGLLLETQNGAIEPALQLGFGRQAVGAGAGQLQIQGHAHWALSLLVFSLRVLGALFSLACRASNAS
ncbi:hypothetical protein D3C72_702490 [compost metagenome]